MGWTLQPPFGCKKRIIRTKKWIISEQFRPFVMKTLRWVLLKPESPVVMKKALIICCIIVLMAGISGLVNSKLWIGLLVGVGRNKTLYNKPQSSMKHAFIVGIQPISRFNFMFRVYSKKNSPIDSHVKNSNFFSMFSGFSNFKIA